MVDEVVIDPDRRDETEFLASLMYMATLYNWPLSALQNDEPYPANIGYYFQQAQFLLAQTHPKRQLMIMADDYHKATLISIDEYTPEYDVSYIPVEIFYLEIKRKANPARTALIESVMAYLYQTAKVAYYSEQGSYLAWQLECVKDNHESEAEFADDDDKEDYKDIAREVDEKIRIGEACRRLMARKQVLTLLDKRRKKFKPVTSWDKDICKAAREIASLIADFPDRRLDASSFPDLKNEDDHSGENEEIGLDASVSFIWNTEGEVYEQVSQSIDSDVQGGMQFERSKSIQVFDRPQPTDTHSLDYEDRLFKAIDKLCTALYKIEEYEQRNEPVPASL